ncbi:MAG: hypothetical protein RMJ37_01375 [Spirochaetia bacterium]|nr:hypothetical protein [Spirochaetota bacterium]MCX8097220.1 hypothetical protein [Spirochaetota bacterium]MDW8111974.1 hypothetical protein [Spirochaetia bacterium]
MPESAIPAYGVIKCRFKAVSTNTFGLAFISFNLLSKSLEKIQVASSHFSSIYENNPQMPWHDFEEKIVNIKWKGEYSISITNDIQKAIDYELKSKDRVDEIIYFINKNATPKIAEFIQNVLQRPTGDRNVSIDVEIETISQEEIEEISIKRIKKESDKKLQQAQQSSKQDADEFNLPQNSIVLEAALVLSPITGVPVYELKPGDKVLTRITEKTQRGQYFKELLGAISPQTNEERPIPSTVEQIKVVGKNYVILTSIGPGVYGKSIEEDNVKIKKYEGEIIKGPRLDQGLEESSIAKEDNTINIIIFVGIAAGGLILIALILMLLGFF